MTPIPKPVKRIRDPEAVQRKVAGSSCRICGRTASDGHHVVLRSQGGDDIEANIVPLCHECHMRYHGGGGQKIKLTTEEFRYVIAKLGREAGLAYMQKRRLGK